MKNFTPYDSETWKEHERWEQKVAEGEIPVVDSIVTWIDIIGFGDKLSSCSWDLKVAASRGLFAALNSVYMVGARPNVCLLNGNADTTERSLVLNDGIAKALDIPDYQRVDPIAFLYFSRDILLTHHICVRVATKSGFPGIRAVVAVGQRAQYSPEFLKGMAYYTNKPANPQIQKLLKLSVTNNPAPFQMNTGFSLAYTVERLGAKAGLKTNGIYFLESAVDFIMKLFTFYFTVTKCEDGEVQEILIGNADKPYIKFRFLKHPEMTKVLGRQVCIFQCLGYTAYEAMENEVVDVDLSKLCS